MQPKEGKSFHSGPHTHADPILFPNSDLLPKPTVPLARYGPGIPEQPYVRGRYTNVMDSAPIAEQGEKREYPPRVTALFNRVVNVFYDHYGVAIQLGGVGKEGEGVRNFDVQFLPDAEVRKFSTAFQDQDYFIKKLPSAASSILTKKNQVYATSTTFSNILALSRDYFLKYLGKQGKLSDQEKLEATKSTLEMLRFLVPSIVQLLPEGFRVDPIPEAMLDIVFNPEDGELAKKVNFAKQETSGIYNKDIDRVALQMKEGLQNRPDTLHSSPSVIIQGILAQFMMKDWENEGLDTLVCTIGNDAQITIADALSMPLLTKILGGIDQEAGFKDWFSLPETWLANMRKRMRGRTPSRHDQTLMNKAQQMATQLDASLLKLRTSAQTGREIVRAIVFPPHLEVDRLRDQEDMERFAFSAFIGGTMGTLLYNARLRNEKGIGSQLKRNMKSDAEYGTFAS